MEEIGRHLTDTKTAFEAQCRRRDALVASIRQRLDIEDDTEYEKLFFKYYGQLTEEERFEFDLIRALTEGLQARNRKMLEILNNHPEILDSVPQMPALRRHLALWIDKYERIFSGNPKMCLLYVGVEDGVPFPRGIDEAVGRWLREHKPPAR